MPARSATTTAAAAMPYRRVQTGWLPMLLCLGLLAAAPVLTAHGIGRVSAVPAPGIVVPLILVAAALLIISSATLIVEVREGELRWRFLGGLSSRRVPLASIARVEPRAALPFSYGWGLHSTPEGWCWRVGGDEALRIVTTDGTSYLLGTDDAERLRLAILSGMRRA